MRPEFLDGPHGQIAFERVRGKGPCVVWLGGFRSDMTGSKATCLADWARKAGQAYLRFDYSGHGASAGEFERGSISAWTEDARYAVETLTTGPLVLVGSSMGGWIAALLALALPERVASIVFVAPAPDFTEELVWPNLSEAERRTLERDGRLLQPSDYGPEPEILTSRLFEDGRRNLVLNRAARIACPVRILQGMKDADVPYRHALRFAELLGSDDVEITLVKGGDHRLSTPADLERLARTVEAAARG